jgi:cyclomaltodextrinase
MIKHKSISFHLALCSILLLLSCNSKEKLIVPSSDLILDNVLPINLQPKETIIHVNDIFINEKLLDSVSARPFLTAKISNDKKLITLTETAVAVPPLVYLKLYSGNYEYSVILKRSQKVMQEFKYLALGTAPTKVQLAGDFNGWTPANTELVFDGKVFSCKLLLSPGKYAYQLVVDDKWMLDPMNPEKVDNNMGGVNSQINIGKINSAQLPKLVTNWADGNLVRIETTNKPTQFFVLWDNFDLTKQFTSYENGILEIKIPEAAASSLKSCIRVYSYNNEGASNDLLIPLKNGNVVKQAADLNRTDKAAMIMYFMMVDRFKDGDHANNFPVKDANVLAKANYYGGDITGIDEKIQDGYFNQLGINTIWLSPIVQNPKEAYVEYPAPHRKYSGYHGYWPISSTQIDYRFGNEKVFKSTIKHAHHKNINILIDYVSNHVHEKHPLYINHKDWTTPIDLPDGRKNIRIWDEQRLTTWFDTFLPDIDYTKPEVVDAMSDSAMYWLDKYGIDGFRHDATKHVSEDFWRALTKKIKTYAHKNKVPVPYQIGETFGSRELIGSYVSSGQQNAQFDFNLYFDARSVFVNDNEPFTKLSESLNESFNYYGWHSLMGNISGNHDIARFISYAGQDLKFTEDDKEAGWNRNIIVKNKVGYKKLAQLIAYISTIPGVPVIYYGDEIGMPGAGDPDNRRMMKFDHLSTDEAHQLVITKQLLQLRKKNIALIYGDYNLLKADKKVMAYARYYFDSAAFVFFNKENKTIKFKVNIPEKYAAASLKKHFNGKFSIQDNELIIELEPNSFEIITTK